MQRPAFFEEIRAAAARRWDHLEADREDAAIWRQLFRQVQIPRHVVSELLQNADDACATRASVAFDGDEFIFSHDGEDFTVDHFRSLCRFGYSNKRNLHTVGFRGIGFKSTFSLGDVVGLRTPTLSVVFHKGRFTEPVWDASPGTFPAATEVRVRLADAHRREALERNLEEWLANPASLLFFRHIRGLSIGERSLGWIPQGSGPVTNSEWMSSASEPGQRHLVVHSDFEDFPADALAEVREERFIDTDDGTGFPPCRVDLVTGVKGRLFVVLPTEVASQLPFACNGPFVQDPARMQIKDPSTSPTNRWLLTRLGQLAASSLLAWLRSTGDIESRACAYQLLPDVDWDDPTLAGACATVVEQAVKTQLEKEQFVLTATGELTVVGSCVSIPREIAAVWSPPQLQTGLADGRATLAPSVSDADCQKLVAWQAASALSKSEVLGRLKSCGMPKPRTWRQLLTLWSYVSSEVSPYYQRQWLRSLRIVPVQGKDTLHQASEVTRLGEKKLLQSDADWEFLSAHLLALNQNWLRFLQEKRQTADENGDEEARDDVAGAYKVLVSLELDKSTDANQALQRIAAQFVWPPGSDPADCIRLAQIAAKLDVSVDERFRFPVRDGSFQPASAVVLADEGGQLQDWLPESWYALHTLAPTCWERFTSCTPDEWKQWVRSDHSRLATFPPLSHCDRWYWSRSDIREVAERRGLRGDLEYQYKTNRFVLRDPDFDGELWAHWRALATNQPKIWAQLVARILTKESASFWSSDLNAVALHVATTGTCRRITSEPLTAGWLDRLTELPCLEDDRGACRQPAELLCRTAATEALLGAEPFVHAEIDSEANRPLLLALGVRNTPTGPGQILARLQALSKAPAPPFEEVFKWYRRLDQLVEGCTTEQVEQVRASFRGDKLVISATKEWVASHEVYLQADENDAPGAAVVHSAVADLALWRRVGIAERPTRDLALAWLRRLPSGTILSPDQIQRTQALLRRYPEEVWADSGHWLNLDGRWTPTQGLEYALTMQALVPWRHLYPSAREKIADFRWLPAELTMRPPFSSLVSLGQRLENRPTEAQGAPIPRPMPSWLITIASLLERILLPDPGQTSRVRELATRLRVSKWYEAAELSVIPYLDGTPAGTAQSVNALWSGTSLYVCDGSAARIARCVLNELQRAFDSREIAEVLTLCYDRQSGFVREAVEGTFTLDTGPAGNGESEGGIPAPDPSGSRRRDASAVGDEPEPVIGDGRSLPSAVGTPIKAANTEGATTNLSGMSDAVEPAAGDSSEEPCLPAQHRASTPAGPSLLERFARSRGYAPDGSSRFRHPDGSWMARAADNVFAWDLYARDGNLCRSYWVSARCLEEKPLELPSEVWDLCTRLPDTHALVLADRDGEPTEVTGRQLGALCERDELRVFPATYRLVYVPAEAEARAGSAESLTCVP